MQHVKLFENFEPIDLSDIINILKDEGYQVSVKNDGKFVKEIHISLRFEKYGNNLPSFDKLMIKLEEFMERLMNEDGDVIDAPYSLRTSTGSTVGRLSRESPYTAPLKKLRESYVRHARYISIVIFYVEPNPIIDPIMDELQKTNDTIEQNEFLNDITSIFMHHRPKNQT